MLPIKKSNQWLGIFIFYTLTIFIGFVTTRVILGSEIYGRYLVSLIFISIVSALIPCLEGYLGKQRFFIIYTFSAIIGILYMFYVVLGNTAPGWGDLTSIVGYLFILGAGTGLALIMEIVSYFMKGKQAKSKIDR